MPRKTGGPLGTNSSQTLAVRVPNALAEKVLRAAGGKKGLAAWLRTVIENAAAEVDRAAFPWEETPTSSTPGPSSP